MIVTGTIKVNVAMEVIISLICKQNFKVFYMSNISKDLFCSEKIIIIEGFCMESTNKLPIQTFYVKILVVIKWKQWTLLAP